MTKGRRSRIHWQLAIDAGMRRVGRDEETSEAEQRELDPDYNPSTLGGADADDRPVLLDADAQAKLLGFLRGKIESDHLVEIAQFLSELRDDAGEAEDGTGLEAGPGGVAGAGMPWTPGARDSKPRELTFDERFPELARIKNLGGSGVATPARPAPSDGLAERRFPELARIRVL